MLNICTLYFIPVSHMSAGIAIVFKSKFGKPLTVLRSTWSFKKQKVVYSLVTKPNYNKKPNIAD